MLCGLGGGAEVRSGTWDVGTQRCADLIAGFRADNWGGTHGSAGGWARETGTWANSWGGGVLVFSIDPCCGVVRWCWEWGTELVMARNFFLRWGLQSLQSPVIAAPAALAGSVCTSSIIEQHIK